MTTLSRRFGAPATNATCVPLSLRRLVGRLAALKPLLDQLVATGFRLDPAGAVYREALARVGEVL